MALHGIAVDVTKTVSSQVFFVFDDADPRFADWRDGELPYLSMDAMRDIAIEAAKKLHDGDWDSFIPEIDIEGVERIPAEDAAQYECVNLSTLDDEQIAEMTAKITREREMYQRALDGLRRQRSGKW